MNTVKICSDCGLAIQKHDLKQILNCLFSHKNPKESEANH